MALILGDLYEETRARFQLTLIAGAAGLRSPMRWVYVAEDYTTSDFLRGGELIITTGVTSGGSAEWLLRFLRHMTAQGTCGLIVNVGQYLQESDISQEVLDFCNQRGFPLFLMPWHIHIYDITREYYNRIFLDARRSEEINRAFLALASGREQPEAIRLLGENHFPPNAPYYLASFRFPAGQAPKLLDDERFLNLLFSRLLHVSFPCYLVTSSNSFFLVCQHSEPAAAGDAVNAIRVRITKAYPGLTCLTGVSGQLRGLTALASGLEQAETALLVGEHRQLPVTHYENLGFFKLLGAVSDPDVLRAYVEEQLSPVREYDRKHQSDFARTLRLYLENNHSIQAVAELSFCHRNTVNHRLHLMREVMGYQLDSPEVCFSLLTAFRAEEYLQITGKARSEQVSPS